MTEEQLKAKSNAILDKLEEGGFDLDDWSIEDAHNNGYIDGYHEGFKDCAKSRLNVTTISDCPIKDEWHKPSERLPEECSLVLAYLFEETEPTICEYVVSDQWECLPKRIVYCSNDQVRKWKEIVLPKESEQK